MSIFKQGDIVNLKSPLPKFSMVVERYSKEDDELVYCLWTALDQNVHHDKFHEGMLEVYQRGQASVSFGE